MIRIGGWLSSLIAVLPMGLLLALTSVPLIFLVGHVSAREIAIDWSALWRTIRFAAGGAAISTIVGAALGILAGTREYPGRRWLFAVSIGPIAAPPAFWWIGAARLTAQWGNVAGPAAAALVGGLALSPVTLLLVFAALRQMPSNVYEAARIALPGVARIRIVLLPLLRSSLAGAFVLTLILLLGESELPFLFGFRTLMTDVVTAFSQTFDVSRTLPFVLPLLFVIVVLGVLVAKPLLQAVLASSRGSHGIRRRRGSVLLSVGAAMPAACLLISLSGYALPVFAGLGAWKGASIDFTTVAVSIIEPVASAWIAILLTLVTAYPARRSRMLPYVLWAGLLLFCVPAAIYAIGWIATGLRLGGFSVPPVVAYTSRTIALGMLGFGIGYARLPASLENAARLVQISPIRRAFVFILPLIAASLMASSALAAALIYADRDVASLLLAPGASRLTLNLYLASANAPSSLIGVLAFAALGGATMTVILAAAGPAVLWRRRV